MFKKFSFVTLSAVLLAACNMNGTVIEDGADSSAASSTEMSSTASVSSVAVEEATDVWTSVKAWAPTLAWSNTVRGTSDTAITIDAEHMIPAGAIQVSSAMTPITAQQYLMIFQGPSRAALDASLATDGWTTLSSLDADGPTGTQWGYTKTDASGIQFIVVSAIGTNCTGTPAACTTYMAKISATDALSEGDDL